MDYREKFCTEGLNSTLKALIELHFAAPRVSDSILILKNIIKKSGPPVLRVVLIRLTLNEPRKDYQKDGSIATLTISW